MPNWSKGVLKVRGKKKDIINFLNSGIERYGYPRKGEGYTELPLNIQCDEFGDILCEETDEKHHSWLYFKNSRRLFVDGNIEWYCEDDENIEQVMALDIKQAWKIDEEYFVDTSKNYNIDFKLMTFENGCCFTQEIEVVKGELILNRITEYEENYAWEVYDPRLGG